MSSGEKRSAEGPTTGDGDGDRHGDVSNREDERRAERLVPPEEHLLELLEENGGRMKQSDVVGAVEWSESTVSRKLGDLESAGAVTRYRIGRGKLVFLPGAEPECIRSPFDAAEDGADGESDDVDEEKRTIPA